MYFEKHKPVLLEEITKRLEIKEDDIVFDGTFGEGGHAKAISSEIGKEGIYIAVDLNSKSIERNKSSIESKGKTYFIDTNFINIKSVLKGLSIPKVTKIILDLGWGTHQIEYGEGFSFNINSKLKMQYADSEENKPSQDASDVINSYHQKELERIIKLYGEERWAGRIAREIVKQRNIKRIETTFELRDIVCKAIPRKFYFSKIHPATKTFQALRILVNNEISNLENFLKLVPEVIEENGKIAIISFHSIEDRIIKNTFKDWEKEGIGLIETKKPIKPTRKEIKKNKKARSAKLRLFTKNKI